MKLQISSFIGCVLLFSVALAQPYLEPAADNDLSGLENLLNGANPAINAHHEFHAKAKKRESDQQNSVGSDIPLGYNEFARHDNIIVAFKLNKTKSTWNEARETCDKEGAFLGYPVSGKEGRKYHDILKREHGGGAWIGLHDLLAEGDWMTVVGKKVNNLKYINWALIEPNNYGNNENCAEIYDKDGRWYDTQCDKKLFFFCKINIRTKKNKF